MTARVQNFEIAGKRTSLRLEQPFWEALKFCARRRGVSLDELVASVIREGQGRATMASTLRVFMIEYFHALANGRQENAAH
jgi:predicted DNA-binding ribbon-helix-helix protein